MTVTHTPAPWRLDGPRTSSLTADGDDYHCIDAGDRIGPPDGVYIAAFMTLADARLIAAAPDLLAAARSIGGLLTIGGADLGEALTELNLAITKAEGGK